MKTTIQRLVIVVLLGLSGCSLPSPRCMGHQSAMVLDQLYFGTQTPSGQVSHQDWNDFLVTEVTPRFPDGLTHWPATGQWRKPDRTIVHENSYVLSIVHPGAPRDDEAMERIILHYKQRFAQESVLRVRSPACASF